MQIHTLDKAMLINEVQLGTQLNHAVEGGRRADFALMLAMLSPDYLEKNPTDVPPEPGKNEAALRAYFELSDPQPLTSTQNCYENAAAQANAFHQGGLASSQLLHDLQPTALTFPPSGTKGMPEELYHNLSGHERRRLAPTDDATMKASPKNLYLSLIQSKRYAEMYQTEEIT